MKIQFVKKTLLIVLIFSMFAVTACSDGKQEAGPAVTPTGTESTVKTSSEQTRMYWEMLNEVEDTSDLPDWKGKTLSVRVWYSHANGVPGALPVVAENDVYLKEIERVTGVHLDVDGFFDNNGVDMNARLPLLLAAKDLPELVFLSSMAWATNLVNAGKLYDLTDYMDYLDQFTSKVPMDEYSTYYRKRIGNENGIYLLSTFLNMEYYMLNPDKYPDLKQDILTYIDKCMDPVPPSGRTGENGLLVRQDILLELYPDALTMDDITEIYMKEGTFTREQIYDIPINNAEDFFNFLEQVRECIERKNLTGINGRKMDVTYGPYVGMDNWGWMEDLPQLIYGLTHNNYFSAFNIRTGTFEVPFREESGKTMLKNLNILLRKGLIAPDSLVDDQNTFNEKINNAQYAVLYAQNGKALNKKLIDEGHAEYIYRPLHINMDWDSDYPTWQAVPEGKGIAIIKDSVKEEDLPQLLHWANYMLSDLHSKLMYWGPRSAGLFKEVDGKRFYTDPDLEACMLYNVNNGAGAKYGLKSDPANGIYVVNDNDIEWVPKPVGRGLYTPRFMYDKKVNSEDAMKYFNPAVVGRTRASTYFELDTAPAIWNYTAVIDELNDFWNARSGFEDLMKKVVASESDEMFERNYQELLKYAESNGLTDNVVEKWKNKFLEDNEEFLRKAGAVR